MPSIILECKQLYPDITIHLYEARGEQLFDYISEENNFIIINGYTKEKEKFLTTDIRSRDLSFFPLFNDELCIFLNSNHPYAQYKKPFLDSMKYIFCFYQNLFTTRCQFDTLFGAE